MDYNFTTALEKWIDFTKKCPRTLLSFELFLKAEYLKDFVTESDAIQFILMARAYRAQYDAHYYWFLVQCSLSKDDTDLEEMNKLINCFRLEYYKFIKSHSKKPYNLMKLDKLSTDQLKKKLLKNARNNPK
jgi:hypothetical protein